MLEGDLVFSLLSLAAGALCLFLGIFVWRRSPDRSVSFIFFISMALATLNAVGLFLLSNAADKDAAILFGRMVVFTGVLISASFLYLSYFLPYERNEGWPVRNRNVFIALVVTLALIPTALTAGVYNDSFGYWLDWSPAILLWLGLVVTMTAIPVYMLTVIGREATNKAVKWQAKIISVGFVLPVLFVIMDSLLVSPNFSFPHLPAVGLLLTAGIFSYAVLRHKLFIIEPVKEESIGTVAIMDPGVKLSRGHCDLVEGKKADLSYRIFVAEVAAGNKGLLITRIHPDQVRERYGLVKTPILWLSSQPGPDRVDPTSLSILQHTIVDFLQKGASSVILLDGLEYLVSENQVDKVLRLIYTIHDAVVISGSKLIVPIDSDIMEQRDLALFEKEFDVIEDRTAKISD